MGRAGFWRQFRQMAQASQRSYNGSRTGEAVAESLEGRLLLSAVFIPQVFKKMEVLARTGDLATTSLGNNVSINDSGSVAFQGSLTTGQGLFIANNSGVHNVTQGFQAANRRFSPFTQITDSNQVVGAETVSGTPLQTLVRVWDINSKWQLIDRGNSDYTSGYVYSAVLLPVANNNGTVVYSALKNSLSNNHQYLESTTGAEVDLGVGSISIRPQISDNNLVVYRDGNSPTSPIQLANVSSSVGSAPATIASSASGFSALGQSPGISDDGSVVAFYGQDKNGPGIFISAHGHVDRVLGTSAGLELDPGDTEHTDNPFTSFVADSRVGVNVLKDVNHTVELVFMATGTADFDPAGAAPRLGIYSVRLVADQSASPSATGYRVGSIDRVIGQGDNVSGLGAAQSFAIYDPVNNSGQVAYWVSNAAGKAAIVRSTRAPDTKGLATNAARYHIYQAAMAAAQAAPQAASAAFDDAATQSLIKNHEGLVPFPYLDTADRPTIGYGFLLDGSDGSLKQYAALGPNQFTYKQLVDAATANGQVDGQGHLLRGTPQMLDGVQIGISQSDAAQLFQSSYPIAISMARSAVWDFDQLSGQAREALVDMAYGLGPKLANEFHRFTKDLDGLDIPSAAVEMIDSKWATDVGQRRATDDFKLLVASYESELTGLAVSTVGPVVSFAAHFGQRTGADYFDATYDLVHDGVINILDYFALLATL